MKWAGSGALKTRGARALVLAAAGTATGQRWAPRNSAKKASEPIISDLSAWLLSRRCTQAGKESRAASGLDWSVRSQCSECLALTGTSQSGSICTIVCWQRRECVTLSYQWRSQVFAQSGHSFWVSLRECIPSTCAFLLFFLTNVVERVAHSWRSTVPLGLHTTTGYHTVTCGSDRVQHSERRRIVVDIVSVKYSS